MREHADTTVVVVLMTFAAAGSCAYRLAFKDLSYAGTQSMGGASGRA